MDVNNGDSQNPVYTPRLAGQEFNTTPDNSLYAATPLLEAARYMMCHAGTFDEKDRRKEESDTRGVLSNDVSRA